MPKMLNVGRAARPTRAFSPVKLHDLLLKDVRTIPGFEGSTVWQSQSDHERYMVVNQYSDASAAEMAPVRLAEGKFMPAVIELFADPIDIRSFEVVREDGELPHQVPVGGYLSISDRKAEPGFGSDLETELARIFGELSAIPGYRGSVLGHGVALPEEVMGIVTWNSPEAYAQSLPLKVLYEVQLFKRIH